MNQQIKFFIFLGLLAIYQFSQTACTGCNRPEPNFEGVLMENCGKNGLADFKIVTGSQGVLGPCSELYQVPMFEQKGRIDSFGVTSKDGGYFRIQPVYTWKALRGKGPEICLNYKHIGPQENDFMDGIETNVLEPNIMNVYREEARNYSNDSLLNHVAAYETKVEDRLKKEFNAKFADLLTISSNLKPPKSMVEAIESKNNVDQQIDQAKKDLELTRIGLEKAKIEREKDLVKSQGLTKEILQDKWIDAIRNTQNKVIITDGKTPVIVNQQ